MLLRALPFIFSTDLLKVDGRYHSKFYYCGKFYGLG